MLARMASSTTAAACSTPRTGRPLAVASATRRSTVSGGSDVAGDDLDLGSGRAHALDLGERIGLGRRTGVQHDAPAPGRRHLRGEEQAETAQAAGDDVGAVAAEHRACSGGTTTWLWPTRGTDGMSLPVCSAALITRIAVAASASG